MPFPATRLCLSRFASNWIALILIIVGGFNWGFFGAFKFDLVAAIFGSMSAVARIVYVLVGLSAIYTLARGMQNPRAYLFVDVQYRDGLK